MSAWKPPHWRQLRVVPHRALLKHVEQGLSQAPGTTGREESGRLVLVVAAVVGCGVRPAGIPHGGCVRMRAPHTNSATRGSKTYAQKHTCSRLSWYNCITFVTCRAPVPWPFKTLGNNAKSFHARSCVAPVLRQAPANGDYLQRQGRCRPTPKKWRSSSLAPSSAIGIVPPHGSPTPRRAKRKFAARIPTPSENWKNTVFSASLPSTERKTCDELNFSNCSNNCANTHEVETNNKTHTMLDEFCGLERSDIANRDLFRTMETQDNQPTNKRNS